MTNREKRCCDYRAYLLGRNPSEKFIRTYFVYLGGSIVKKYLTALCGTDDIFAISDVNKLSIAYEQIKVDENNVRLHNVYSGAVGSYIKFLQGKPLRVIAKQNK